MVEGLKCILNKAKEVGLIDGVYFDTLSDEISQLQFADDTLIFLPTEIDMLLNLKRVLRCFKVVSGLKI